MVACPLLILSIRAQHMNNRFFRQVPFFPDTHSSELGCFQYNNIAP